MGMGKDSGADAERARLEAERLEAEEKAKALAQEQTDQFRDKQRRGVKSLVETSESGTLG